MRSCAAYATMRSIQWSVLLIPCGCPILCVHPKNKQGIVVETICLATGYNSYSFIIVSNTFLGCCFRMHTWNRSKTLDWLSWSVEGSLCLTTALSFYANCRTVFIQANRPSRLLLISLPLLLSIHCTSQSHLPLVISQQIPRDLWCRATRQHWASRRTPPPLPRRSRPSRYPTRPTRWYLRPAYITSARRWSTSYAQSWIRSSSWTPDC